ncbi:unnamed protein product [Hyaloperonospora brassicae]|uniref:CCT domain-containing protein n=1 Tax=Hyaloperonospora brassicae TaxID=162125 RepID=A0AAV0TES0_HYABA|nr:unnamed protein product [Hyaloperonospora brassicae]
MIESEVAAMLMSLSAPDERHSADNPLYAATPPLSTSPSSWQAGKKRAFAAFDAGAAASLPSSSFLHPRAEGGSSPLSLLQLKIQGRPLTSLIPGRLDIDSISNSSSNSSSASDVDMDASYEAATWSSPYRSSFDGLVAAAVSTQDDNDRCLSSNSRPISIPSRSGHRTSHSHNSHSSSTSSLMRYRDPSSLSSSYGKKHKGSSLSRVQEDKSFLGRDCSPTGVEDDSAWYDSDYKQRVRLASVCSSDGSEYGGLGRKHLEEFIRMEISAVHDSEQQQQQQQQHRQEAVHEGKFVGSYSPDARRKRIERFLEKRKHRVWAKKVDYDVRKNFANSRLRVKGRFVKKEDEELLCQLLSYT